MATLCVTLHRGCMLLVRCGTSNAPDGVPGHHQRRSAWQQQVLAHVVRLVLNLVLNAAQRIAWLICKLRRMPGMSDGQHLCLAAQCNVQLLQVFNVVACRPRVARNDKHLELCRPCNRQPCVDIVSADAAPLSFRQHTFPTARTVRCNAQYF